MPTYQYACTECGHSFEQVQSFTDDSLTVCPVCEGRLRKVYNAVGVVFKGSGFYRNDSRPAGSGESSGGDSAKSSDSSAGAGGSGSGEKKADKPAEKKAESAPAKKADSKPASSPST